MFSAGGWAAGGVAATPFFARSPAFRALKPLSRAEIGRKGLRQGPQVLRLRRTCLHTPNGEVLEAREENGSTTRSY